MVLFFLLACSESTLQPVVEAGAALIAEDAAPAAAFALGAASLSASLCVDTQADWRARAGTSVELSAEVGALLGRSDAGSVRFDEATGLAEVLWSADGDGRTLRLTVDRPQTSFILREQQSGDTGLPESVAELRMSTSGCHESPNVGVSGTVDAPFWPSSIGTEAPLAFASPEATTPQSGVLRWQDADVRRRGFTTDDAAALSDWSWPGTAADSDWTWPQSLALLESAQ